jgi:hypothetical protein
VPVVAPTLLVAFTETVLVPVADTGEVAVIVTAVDAPAASVTDDADNVAVQPADTGAASASVSLAQLRFVIVAV